LFVADGLSQLINRKIGDDSLKELKICRGAPGISHLLFADDTLLFFRAAADQAELVKDILASYERCTGQLLNAAKCSIMFSPKGNAEDQEAVKSILGVHATDFDAKYLGLPTARGRMKRDKFQTIKERMGKRLMDYSEKLMSSGAKEVLIKAVAQSLPTYLMSVFQIPLTLCDELASLIHEFWWGTDKGKRKMAWLAWDQLVLKKCWGVSVLRTCGCLTKPCLPGKHDISPLSLA
jgi:hypothetical protein